MEKMNLLEQFKILERYQRYAPVDVLALVREFDITVKFEELADDISGYIEKTEAGYKIGVNESDDFVKQKFTMAHELGHWWYHTDYLESRRDQRITDIRMYKRSPGKTTVPVSYEFTANSFAVNVLMPVNLIGDLILHKKVTRIKELAELLEVYEDAVEVRVKGLGFAIDP